MRREHDRAGEAACTHKLRPLPTVGATVEHEVDALALHEEGALRVECVDGVEARQLYPCPTGDVLELEEEVVRGHRWIHAL